MRIAVQGVPETQNDDSRIRACIARFCALSAAADPADGFLRSGLADLRHKESGAQDSLATGVALTLLYAETARLEGLLARREAVEKGVACPYSEPESHISPSTALKRHFWKKGWHGASWQIEGNRTRFPRTLWGVVQTAHFDDCLNKLIDRWPAVNEALKLTLPSVAKGPFEYEAFCKEPCLRTVDLLPWPGVPRCSICFTVSGQDIVLHSIQLKVAPKGATL